MSTAQVHPDIEVQSQPQQTYTPPKLQSINEQQYSAAPQATYQISGSAAIQ